MKSWPLQLLLVGVAIVVTQAVEPGCYWSGTAPICHGSCKTGEVVMGSSHVGEGATCVTGKKKLCCKPNGTTTPAPAAPAVAPVVVAMKPATPVILTPVHPAPNQIVVVQPVKTHTIELVPVSPDCYWSGTAPFCEGSCKAGEIVKESDDIGDGTTCLTGKKRLCCKST